jgi:N-acetylmuramoyl-L-alanine amidase
MKAVIILSFTSFVFITLIGGSFWYFQKMKSQTTFENQQQVVTEENKETQEQQLAEEKGVEELKEAPTSAETTDEKPAAKDEKKIEAPSKTTEEAKPKNFSIKQALVSFGHESASGRKIDTIILHSSHSVSGDPYDTGAVVALWKSYGVAPHYMIARDGTVSQLVADKNIAYHAGEGKMKDGRTGINDFSIGVEILNTKDDQYTKAQYQAVKDLIAHLKGKYGIKYVVGHDDIAPGRKTDPWNFDWNKI